MEEEIIQDNNPVLSSRPPSRPDSGESSSNKSRPSSSNSTNYKLMDVQPGTDEDRPQTVTGDRPSSVKSGSSIWPAAAESEQDAESILQQPDDIIFADGEPPKGCWYSFSKCIGGMWSTREMNNGRDREVYVRTTIRELVVYSIFLVVLCILTFGMTSATKFYYTQILINLFKEHTEVQTVNDFWKFMESDMLDGMYWEYSYNVDDDDTKAFLCPHTGSSSAVGPCPTSQTDRNILYENRLLGLPRLRQLRVKNDSCFVPMLIQEMRISQRKNDIHECYDEYSKSIEDPSNFSLGKNGKYVKTHQHAWVYQTENELKGTPVSGSMGDYSGAGFIQDLNSLKNESAAIINELKQGLWISSATRFISLDFTVYNANINLFCIIKLTFQFAATGGIFPASDFRTVKLLRYVTAWDYFILACELIFCAFVAYYIVEEVLEIRKHKFKYFFYIWNVLDIVVIAICGVVIFFNVFTMNKVETELINLLSEPDKFADFTYLGWLTTQNGNAVAICVFLAWIKLFKYLSFNKTMTQLTKTLSRCAKDMAGFGVMFFVVFFAFALFGYVLFGPQVKDFSTFSDSIFTLLRIILGDFDFPGMVHAQPELGPMYFFSYVVSVFFILLNMFLAIINDTYSEVKAELEAQQANYEISDYFKRSYNNMLERVVGRNKGYDIEGAMKLAGTDGKVTYEEVRQNLKKCNFSDLEIEMFFARYDVDGDFELDEEERKHVMDKVKDGSVNGPTTTGEDNGDVYSGPPPPNEVDMEQLTMRIDRMEQNIGAIVEKIESALFKLSSVEKTRAKRKEAMSKILGTIIDDSGVDDETRKKKVEQMLREELHNLDSRPGTAT